MRQVRAGVLVGVRPMGDGIEVRFKWKGKTWRPRLRLAATGATFRPSASAILATPFAQFSPQ